MASLLHCFGSRAKVTSDSLIDECGGHTNEYHFHERMACLFKAEGGHSAKVGEADIPEAILVKYNISDLSDIY